MIKVDGSVIHFNNPKVQASLSANTFAVTGHAETKRALQNSLLLTCVQYTLGMLNEVRKFKL